MMIKDLNPEAEEFLPPAFPYETHQKPHPEEPVSSIPLSPYYTSCYQKILLPQPRVLAPPWYIVDKFGAVHYPPSVPCLVSFYDVCHQPQPHGLIKVPLAGPINHRADEGGATAAGRAGNGAKNLMAKVSAESFGGKILNRRKQAWVPKTRGMRSPPCPTLEDGVRTTVMIKNIPNQFRRHMLIDFLDKLCLEQNQKSNSESNPPRFEYDFLYLPMDFRRNNNMGYAFVNFTSAVAAARVAEILCGYKWGVFKDSNERTIYPRKVVEITWANSQGKEEMVMRFRNSHFLCQDMEYLPAAFMPARDGANPAASLTVIGRCLRESPWGRNKISSSAQ